MILKQGQGIDWARLVDSAVRDPWHVHQTIERRVDAVALVFDLTHTDALWLCIDLGHDPSLYRVDPPDCTCDACERGRR